MPQSTHNKLYFIIGGVDPWRILKWGGRTHHL